MRPIAVAAGLVVALASAQAGCEAKGGSGGSGLVVSAPHVQVVPRRSHVTLSGFASLPATFSWRQTAGPAVVLQNADAAIASFTAPETEADLVFELRATAGADSATASTAVQVRNQAPVVSGVLLTPASPRVSDAIGVSATVSDPDQDPLTVSYAWKRNGALLTGATTATLAPLSLRAGDLLTAIVSATDGLLATSSEVSTTVGDVSFIFTTTPPDHAAYGSLVQFSISARADDGTPPGDFVLDFGPAGMTVSPAGQVSWTAVLPMFDTTLDVHWRVSLAGYPTNHLAGTIRVEDPLRQPPLYRYGTEIPSGHSTLQVADLDGDGRAEVLVGSGWGLLRIYGTVGLAELALVGGNLVQRWAYPFPLGSSGNIGAVVACDVDGDGKSEIFVAVGDGLLKIDGATRRETAHFQSGGAFFCIDLAVADLDLDGFLEVVCLATPPGSYGVPGRIVVLDAPALTVKWQSADLALGAGMAVGKVDAGASLKIVTAGGFVFDGGTGATVWAYGPGFGDLVAAGDLDGDGIAEIVGVRGGSWARGFSAVSQTPVWELAGWLGAVSIADLDGDGIPEVILGDGAWGYVTAYRYLQATNALTVVFELPAQASGVNSIAAGDLDGDGLTEVVWGSGAGDSGPDSLVVAGRHPAWAVEWTNQNPHQLDGPYRGAKPARLAGGVVRILFGVPSSDNGYGGFRIVALDPETGAFTVSPEQGSNWAGASELDAADIDRDGVDEALIATADLRDGYLAAVDVGAGTAKWTSGTIGSAVSLAHGDLTGDGIADVVALIDGGTTSLLYAYDVKNQVFLGAIPDLPYGGVLAMADLDGDGVPEVVLLVLDQLKVFRWGGSTLGLVPTVSRAVPSGYDLAVADCDGDGVPEIYVLFGYKALAASVIRYDTALRPTGGFDLGAPALSLHVEQLGSGRKNLLVGSGGVPWASDPAMLRAVDPVSGAEIWHSPALWASPLQASLTYLDVGGEPKITFGTTSGMYLTR